MKVIYIEDEVLEHPRVASICERFPDAARVSCARYTEVFNPKAQHFRLQKRNPSLVLAAKRGELLHPVPEGYGLGGNRNFYFSHMLNCVYDCRYCFLQGMFRSAHYVLFVNFEDFAQAIECEAERDATEETWFYSGYDCDSLALEPVTGFMEFFLPRFRGSDGAWLELRTKSTQVRTLLAQEAISNVVIAFSFTPDEVSRALEHRVPTLFKRLAALSQLQRAGWSIGLRFDPLIYHQDFRAHYARLFDRVFEAVDDRLLHSVTLGPFRMPAGFYRTITRYYPDEPLFASPLQDTGGTISYPADIEQEMVMFCRDELRTRVPGTKFFAHTVAN